LLCVLWAGLHFDGPTRLPPRDRHSIAVREL
jgi:hypothetical protein